MSRLVEKAPSDWRMVTLGDISTIGAGGDKTKHVSEKETEEYP